MAYIKCQVLDVGQGLGNLLEVYDSSGVMTSAVLVDFGSECERTTAGYAAAAYVVDRLKTMTPARLSAVVLTHSDADHINLLNVLLDNFRPAIMPGTKPVLYIDRIFYGGDRKKYVKRGTNYLTLAALYLSVTEATGLLNFPNNYTSYNFTTNEWDAFWTVDDLNLYVVCANTTKDGVDLVDESTTYLRKASDGYAINSMSIILSAFYHQSEFIITGDATGLTLAHANQVIAGTGKVFPYVFMVTAPHHGSETTTFDLLGMATATYDRDELPKQNLRDFVNNIGGETLTASAERVKRFKHPSTRVLYYFAPKLSSKAYFADPALSPAQRHFYTAYFGWSYTTNLKNGKKEDWPPYTGWYSLQTGTNIYTTLYFDNGLQVGRALPPEPGQEVDKFTPTPTTTPALGAQWTYFADDVGKRGLTFLPNRTLLASIAPEDLPTLDGWKPSWLTEAPRPRPRPLPALEPELVMGNPVQIPHARVAVPVARPRASVSPRALGSSMRGLKPIP